MNLSIWCGDTFRKSIIVGVGDPVVAVPVDGWEFDGDIRNLATGAIVGTFTFNILGAENGEIELSLTAEQTDALAESSVVCSYQLRFKTPATDVQTFVEGLVFVTRRPGEPL